MIRDETKISLFYRLSSVESVANLLGTTLDGLNSILYRFRFSDNYNTFYINKKNGAARRIDSPCIWLKRIQRELACILYSIYDFKQSASAYIHGRGIKYNATKHVNKKWVFNIDLVDFFQSINFGRVRGMFMASPFDLPPNVATIMSKICCLNNGLPIGAPSSPVVSNIICARMDTELYHEARNCGCSYSRYADDITFSTHALSFPRKIGSTHVVDEILGVEPSYTVQRIIESNGFQINREKIKIYSQNKRQTVTGIVVNEKVNCRRSYIRNLRGKLHALEKYGSDAEALYKSRYVKNSLLSSRHRGSLATHIQGKLAYLKMLKGPYDSVYRKLKHRYDTIIGKPSFYFENINDEISAGLWIIEYLKGEDCFQGTGFFVEGVGLVTCSHVVGDDTIAYRHDSTTNIHKVKVLYNDENRDVAILDIQGVNLQEKYCFSIRENDNLSVGDKIILAGFPEYAPGATPTIINTELSSFRTRSGVRKFQVAAGVYNGNSGGPVFDSNCKVIGIADRGDTASVSTAIHFSELKKCIAELRKKSQDGVDLLPQSTESTPPPPSLLPPQRD